MPLCLILMLALAVGAAAGTGTAATPAAFLQTVSDRTYYRFAAAAAAAAATSPPPLAPWPRVDVGGSPVVLLTTSRGSGRYTFGRTRDGDVLRLASPDDADASQSTPTGIPRTPAGTSVAATSRHDGGGVAVCSPAACVRYACSNNNHSQPHSGCRPTGAVFQHDLGHVSAMAYSASDDTLWVAGARSGLLRIASDGTFAAVPVVGNVTAIAVSPTGDLAVGTTWAVYYDFHPAPKPSFARWIQAFGAAMDGFPTALAWGAGGELWIGGSWCLNVVRPDGITVDRVAGAQGLPRGNITHLDVDADGTLWVGGRQGLSARTRAGDWRYFAGDRWIPGDNEVVALSAPWVATAYGLARIRTAPMQLAAKAAFYTNLTSTVLSRHGWVAAVALGAYGDPATVVQHAGDNDGLWTGMLVSGLIYQYALTGSAEARDLAWRHYAAVEFLHNVTGTRGFIARTAVKCGEAHGGGDSGICPTGSPNTCGWVNSSACYAGVDDVGGGDASQTTGDGCCWTWKRDTSSDEVTGHFFTLLQAWEFLARNDAEKARVARSLCDTADYLLKGGLRFIDPVSGRGTSWGYWDPEQLNAVGPSGKPNERGENSLEVLGYMAAAAKVCGADDPRYGQMFASLVEDYAYDENVVGAMATSPQSLAFFDFRLAAMSFHTLAVALPDLMLANGTGFEAVIPLGKDAQQRLRARMVQSVRRYWNDPDVGATVNGETNYDALMGLVFRRMTGEVATTDDPQYQLKRWPMEMIQWPVRNSGRWDVALERDWLVPPNDQLVLTRALPADEAFGWSDFLTEGASCGVDGGDGKIFQSPGPWLLVYWMQEYNKQN